MRQREFLKRLKVARDRVNEEISAQAQGGKYAAGLASEGYSGGYRDALNDVDAILTNGYPNDMRGYWKQESE